jgi:hypothetical protein
MKVFIVFGLDECQCKTLGVFRTKNDAILCVRENESIFDIGVEIEEHEVEPKRSK